MMTKYPIYIVSKGRYENPITAKAFIKDGLDFQIVVEPQEYDQYCEALGSQYVTKLPFSDLGQGSFPARNFCWEDSIKKGHNRHWVFDDNIYGMRRLYKGKRIRCHSGLAIKVIEDFTDRYTNIGISGFNYTMFVTNTTKKPFVSNVHAYSAMLMKNDMPYRWRMKYNEDVDLCLQVLSNKLCTVLFNAFMVDKVSTTHKMKGGNQTELYKDNSFDKKVLKARSLQEIWPEYVKVVMKFNRPHHDVNWRKHFNHKLIRDTNFDWDSLKKTNNFGMELKAVKEVQSASLKEMLKTKGKTE